MQGEVEMAVLDDAVLDAARCRLLRVVRSVLIRVWISGEILR